MFELINPWAVLVATFAGYMIGWAWYSFLFQKIWMEARGDTGENWETEGKKEMPKLLAYGFLNTLVMAFVIDVVLTLVGVTSLVQALQVGLLLAFGLAVTIKFNDLLYTGTPPHWGRRAQTLFLVDSSYLVVLYAVVSAIVWWMK